MGVQTMSSLGGGGGGGALARQGSVYGLTPNEVESHPGEPLRSMNLEDLLRTVLPAADAETVDEVWRDIESAGRGRQPTVGEMTLEDFLSRAGVPYPPQQYVTRPLPRPLGVGAGPLLAAVYHGGASLYWCVYEQSNGLLTSGDPKNVPPPADQSPSYRRMEKILHDLPASNKLATYRFGTSPFARYKNGLRRRGEVVDEFRQHDDMVTVLVKNNLRRASPKHYENYDGG
ncbi:hypothetical protein VPH35_026851 [Triticum aestivum]